MMAALQTMAHSAAEALRSDGCPQYNQLREDIAALESSRYTHGPKPSMECPIVDRTQNLALMHCMAHSAAAALRSDRHP